MKAIRYDIHFLALIVSAVVYWLAEYLEIPVWISDFTFSYGLIGVLHASSIVASLRDRKAIRPLPALGFVALAALWSVGTPLMGFYGSIVFLPIAPLLRPGLHNLIFVLIAGSAIGSAGYWVLVRWFWIKSLRPADIIKDDRALRSRNFDCLDLFGSAT